MPDVSSHAPADVRLWVALDVHKVSIVAAILPPAGGPPELQRIETTPAVTTVNGTKAPSRAQTQRRSTIASLRALITELRPVPLDDLGIEAAIEDLIRRTRARGLDVDLAMNLATTREHRANTARPNSRPRSTAQSRRPSPMPASTARRVAPRSRSQTR